MRTTTHNISVRQLAVLLLCVRLFLPLSLLEEYTLADAQSVLLPATLLGGLIALAACLPILLLLRRQQGGLLEAATTFAKPLGWLFALLAGLPCLYLAADTVWRFSRFISFTIYPRSQPWGFILCLTLAAGYAAALGLEAFARTGPVVLTLAIICTLVLWGGLAPDMQLYRIGNPMVLKLSPLLRASAQAAAGFTELLLFALLAARVSEVKNRPGRACLGWVLGSTGLFICLHVILVSALGGYVDARRFPLHTAASAAQLGALGRMDLLYLFFWVACAFLRTTVYLYGACVCLGQAAPRMSLGARAAACAVAVGIGACLLIVPRLSLTQSSSAPLWLLPSMVAVLLAVVAPLILLALIPQKPKNTAKQEGSS